MYSFASCVLQNYIIQRENWFQPRHFGQSEIGDFGLGAILKERLRTFEETTYHMGPILDEIPPQLQIKEISYKQGKRPLDE